MNRREFCYLGATTSLLTALGPSMSGALRKNRDPKNARLFFDLDEISRIRANTKTDFLGPLFQKWSSHDPSELSTKLDAFDKTGDIIREYAAAYEELTESTFVQLVTPSQERLDSLLAGIERFLKIPHWDYFLDGPDDVIALQRGSLATARLLFAREVLADSIDEDLDRRMLDTIAEKGGLPCYRAVNGMDNPDTVKGWGFNERHADYYDIEMNRWPEILGANNLRADPTSSLGIAAIALRGHDDRAELWLQTAIDSTRRVLDLFTPDGSYFEGISYAGYTLRTTLSFCEAHQRCIGDIDWSKEANFEGIIEHILSVQAGLQADGTPDIVNFSDSKRTVYPGAPSWIARNLDSPLAQYAAEHASVPYHFLDFLWYEPKRKSMKPPPALKNVHNDLDWVICRSGWKPNDAVLAFKSGGPANHEHADRNHFIYKVYGERLLNDSFGAAYDRRDPHWLLRLTEAHNSVLVNGNGHQYHNGIEGTNDSRSYASVNQYEVVGDTTWWSSDATAAYQGVNERIFKVIRTVLFAKPDIIVVLDQIRLRYEPQRVDLRFFPDNRDNAAELKTNRDSFSITRPNATLHGKVVSRSDVKVSQSKLDLPESYGEFPYIEIGSGESIHHEIITMLASSPGRSSKTPNLRAQATDQGWKIKAGKLRATLTTDRMIPKVQIA